MWALVWQCQSSTRRAMLVQSPSWGKCFLQKKWNDSHNGRRLFPRQGGESSQQKIKPRVPQNYRVNGSNNSHNWIRCFNRNPKIPNTCIFEQKQFGGGKFWGPNLMRVEIEVTADDLAPQWSGSLRRNQPRIDLLRRSGS